MAHPNQYLPVPEVKELEPWIRFYYRQNKNDKEILETLLKYHIDTTKNGLGYSKFRRIRGSLNLLGIRQQGHTIEPGIREMRSHLFTREGMKVPRSVVEEYFLTFEPELMQARIGRKLKRKQFWAAGVNVLWCMDQHDKWKYKFGITFHLCVDPFSGYLLWLDAWHNNSNPMLICSYYLRTVRSLSYVPLLTQSDPGTENGRVANAQSCIRQLLDPQLEGTIQHNWKRNKSNIKAEIEWSQFRRRWSAGFENILEDGAARYQFDTGNPIQVLVFRFVVIPWIQREVDIYRNRLNSTSKRANVHKLTPKGRPEDIHFRPQDFGARDFHINVPDEYIDAAEAEFIDRTQSVFQLVPPSFHDVASTIRHDMNVGIVNEVNVWEVYNGILTTIERDIVTGAIPPRERGGERC